MRSILFLLFLLMTTFAHGEIYRWRDGAGVTHYASSMDDVPARHRERAKSMNYGPEQKGDGARTVAEPKVSGVQPVSVQPSPRAVQGQESSDAGKKATRKARRMRRASVAGDGED